MSILDPSAGELTTRIGQMIVDGVPDGWRAAYERNAYSGGVEFEDFRSYVRHVKPDFRWATHHEIIADHLDACFDGEINRLIVNIPPRHGKSLEITQLFSSYWVRKRPWDWVGLSSYSNDLAGFFATESARFYGASLPTGVRLPRAKKKWATGAGGGVWSAGVGGQATGQGWALGICDDPLKNQLEAASHTYRTRCNEWWDATWSTRGTPDACMILVMTRWEEDDLTGYLLQKEDEILHPQEWTCVVLPAIKDERPYEVPRSCTLVLDPRGPGEALWEDHYSAEQLEGIMSSVGQIYAESLYQQRPRSETGKGRVSENFDRDKNVVHLEPEAYQHGTFFVSGDFNVVPLSAVAGWIYRAQDGLLKVHYTHEFEMMEASTTEEMCRLIRRTFPARFEGRRPPFYPDPSGRNRHTNSKNTDHDIIHSYGFEVRSRKAYPMHVDMANAVNTMLGDRPLPKNLPRAPGYIERPVRLTMEPSLEKLMTCHLKLTWVPGVEKRFDKGRGWDHMYDAAAFVVVYEFPRRVGPGGDGTGGVGSVAGRV